MKKVVSSLFIIGFAVFIFCKDALPWNDEVTHRDLSRYAAECSVLNKTRGDFLKNLGFQNGLREVFIWNKKGDVLEWLQEGSKFEDESDTGFPILPGTTTRSFNHFHNPRKQPPWLDAGLNDHWNGESSLLWAQDGTNQNNFPGKDWSWRKVRERFYTALTGRDFAGVEIVRDRVKREEYFAMTFRGLGHQMHLLQDTAVPDHVRNDAHPEDSIFAIVGGNPLYGSQYFETWTKENADFIKCLLENHNALPPNIHSKCQQYGINICVNIENYSPSVSFNISYNGLVPTTQLFDAEVYNGTNPSVSLAQGLAEYANANFFSGDTIFAAEQYPVDHRHYFPFPKKTSTDLQQYLSGTKLTETVLAEDGDTDTGIWISKTADGEKISHFVRTGKLTRWVYNLLGEGDLFYKTFYRDEKCHEDYASKLIPRAVGYSVGLLDYFFRGDINMVPNTSGSGFVIENNSNEDMDGTFELWYDDANDERKKAWDSRLCIGRESRSSNITFTPPDDMKEDGKYMLVFNGELGKEKGAVTGKVVTLAGATNIFFLVTYGDQLAFKFEVDGNGYKIEPLDREIYLEGEREGWYRTWTVVTDPENKRHFVTFPRQYQYFDFIENYGVRTGTNYLWRPEDFEEESDYILTTTGGTDETDLSVSAVGRHNYTLDNDGRMVTYDESIWAKANNGCTNSDYIYRYKSEQSENNFIDGEVITSDQLGEGAAFYRPGEGALICSGPTINNTMIATLGNRKAIYIENKHWRKESSSAMSERAIEENYTLDTVHCSRVYYPYDTFYYIYSTKTGTFWLNNQKQQDASKTRVALNVAGEEIEAIEFFPHMTQIEKYQNSGGGWDVSGTSMDIGGKTSPECPDASCSVSPETVTFTDWTQSSTEGGTILVHDFDNIPEDDPLIIMYSLSKSLSASKTIFEMECELHCGVLDHYIPSEYSPPLRECYEIGRTEEGPALSKTKEYYVAYRITSETAVKKEILYSETVTGEADYSKILTGFSTQMNKETIIYTYVMKKWNGTGYDFDKRIVGIINVSDPRLPKGYRQEYIIDTEKFSTADFDFTQYAGIGIHKF